MKARSHYAKVTQFLSWPIAYAFFHLFFKIKINNRENLKDIHSPFILISNHIAFFDSFVLRLVIGCHIKMLPLRFMAVRKFNSWFLNLLSALYIIDFLYLLYGVFVVEPGKKARGRNLVEAIKIIENGGNVVMYPEGSINHDDNIKVFRKGAAVLAHKTHVPIIPISMRIIRDNLLRRKFIINIGEKIQVDRHQPPTEITEYLHTIISNLYSKS